MNAVIAGYSAFSWELAELLKRELDGRLYFVLSDPEQAMEASLSEDVIAVEGDLTDTRILDQLDLDHCHTFVAGSRETEANVLSALYAKTKGAQHVYARVFEAKFMPLLESLGIIPIQTSHTAAAFVALRVRKPAVSELVSLPRGRFELDELDVGEFPELVGLRLGNLQGEHLHIIAIAQGGQTHLSYGAVVERDAKLILIYDYTIKRRLRQEIRKVAAQAIEHTGTGRRHG